MPATATTANALVLASDDVINSIRMPACPEMLISLQLEMKKEYPDPKKAAAIIGRDVIMSATLLKTANSSYFNLKRKVNTIHEALAYIGMNYCGSIMTGLIVRKAINTEGAKLTRFWDVSGKRALAMSILAKKLRIVAPDVAHTFGLFCDIGIPLLFNRFSNYQETLQIANNAADESFSSIEDFRHKTCHATIGSFLAKSWGLSLDIAQAINLHHEYEILEDPHVSKTIKDLVALGLIAERIIQTYRFQNNHVEWEKGGAIALDVLGIAEDQMADICADIHMCFDTDI